MLEFEIVAFNLTDGADGAINVRQGSLTQVWAATARGAASPVQAQTATFTGLGVIKNVISWVTGGEVSNIGGEIWDADENEGIAEDWNDTEFEIYRLFPQIEKRVIL